MKNAEFELLLCFVHWFLLRESIDLEKCIVVTDICGNNIA